MAVDTAAKRFNVVLLLRGGPARPDGTLEEADRATLGGVYGWGGINPPASDLDTATTPAQLRALVEAGDLEIDWTMALYDSDDAYVTDITADVSEGTITRNLYRTIHGTAKFRLSRQLLWGSHRLAPSVTLTSEVENLTATWALGRWLTSIPERVVGAVPESYEVEAYDKLLLADKKVGRSYAVASGTAYITAVETILGTELGEASYALDQASIATVTTTTLNWLLDDDTTWLRIINDLLLAINYEGLWVDRNGYYRSRPYRDPEERTNTWSFDADDSVNTIVGETRKVVPARGGEDISDPIDTPNAWTFVNDDIAQAPPTVGAGIYQETNSNNGATSVLARGQTVYSIQRGTFSSQGTLVDFSTGRIVWASRRFNTTLELDTGPCPALWHFDVVDLIDSALGPQRRWAVEEWTMDLPSGDMSHRWRDVQGVT